MTTPGLATPPKAARPRVTRPSSRPPPPPPLEVPNPPRRSFERVLGWSLAISVLAHLLLLLLSPIFIRVDVPPGAAAVSDAEAPDAFGMEMIVAIPSANAPEDPVVEQREDPVVPRFVPPERATPAPPGAGPSPAPTGGDQPERSATDALRPGYRDARLYVAPRDYPDLELTEHERYMRHLEARIEALNDSMAIAANRERRTSDWTVTDRNGNKWGLDGDGLHLGGVSVPRELIPNPRSTGDNATIQAGRERDRQREEIQRQEQDRQRRETQDERIQSTRDAADQGAGGNDRN